MDSPVRRPKKGSVHPHGHTVDSPVKTRSRSRSHPHSHLRYPKRHQERDPEVESWDDEFDLGPNLTSFPPTALHLSPTTRTRHDDYSSSEDENHTHDDADFGFADKEEDRTITARSRRAVLSRLTSSSSGSPPLPVRGKRRVTATPGKERQSARIRTDKHSRLPPIYKIGVYGSRLIGDEVLRELLNADDPLQRHRAGSALATDAQAIVEHNRFYVVPSGEAARRHGFNEHIDPLSTRQQK